MPAAELPLDFAALTPAEVLDALDRVGFRGDGRILQLNSYENRVFRVMLEEGSAVVAKFYRPGRWTVAQILEEHAFTRELADEEVPAMAPLPMAGDSEETGLRGTPPTLLVLGPVEAPQRVSVSPWLGGRDPTVETPAQWQRLGRLIGRVHAVGARTRFRHRTTLTPALGLEAIEVLLALDMVEPSLRPRWESAARRAADGVAKAFERLGPDTTIRLHGDAHRGNLLERGEELHLVDFDDACNGPAMQDLWLFLDGHESDERRRQLDALLRGYEDFMDFDDAQLRLIEPLRTLRLLRHSAWIAQRWSDPAFPRAFPQFGTPNHWADQLDQLQHQIERMA